MPHAARLARHRDLLVGEADVIDTQPSKLLQPRQSGDMQPFSPWDTISNSRSDFTFRSKPSTRRPQRYRSVES